MALQPLSEAELIAAQLREMAKDLNRRADQLEAVYGQAPEPNKKPFVFTFTPKKKVRPV